MGRNFTFIALFFALLLVVAGIPQSPGGSPNRYVNPYFLIKLLLISVAVIFHFLVSRRAASWDDVPVMPVGAKLTGCFSLSLWIGVIAAARWIAYA